MVLLYTSPRFLQHHTGNHPECAERLEHILGHLGADGLTERCTLPQWLPAEDEVLESVHQETMIRSLEQLAKTGGGRADADTVVGPESFDVARLAVGAVCDATTRVLSGEDRRALCLVRPPGHHALRETAMGFCLFNNIALAAQSALNQGIERVLIVDWDVHHGNGTQAIFYDEPRVGFFSVHRWPFYPGTGDSDETGTGAGLGTTRNVPLEFGISQRAYREAVMRELEDFAARMRPQLVLVSAGFDAHRSDPIGSLGLEVEDFAWLTAAAMAIADSYAAGRIVSTLEGGYNPPVLAECVAIHLEGLL
ncbi:histone deacetylase family protein [Bythopirellula polymerisocia]|uniref:Histone deacetylase-like amidohydrolase n=1 Tax=Bythopirellula polymerisocia TaxID=2528003 RepID=A0A5C6CZN0_9BACT|nr:histone deacetylase [Bythopirellula polymerisocia]TWU30050.1 Histone deacetylase-like amidohydrolase [Bythopirellula polymerisocia]